MQGTSGGQVLISIFAIPDSPASNINRAVKNTFSFAIMSPPHDTTLVSKKWTKSYDLVKIADVQGTMVLFKRLSSMSCM